MTLGRGLTIMQSPRPVDLRNSSRHKMPEKEETKVHLSALSCEGTSVLSCRSVSIQTLSMQRPTKTVWPPDACRWPVHHGGHSHRGRREAGAGGSRGREGGLAGQTARGQEPGSGLLHRYCPSTSPEEKEPGGRHS